MMMTKRVRAGALVFREGALLLIHRKKQGKEYYVIPGGGVDDGESPEEACLRELQEETSLTGEIERVAFTIEQEKDVQHYFLVKNTAGEAVLSENSVEAQRSTEENVFTPVWVKTEELASHEIVPREAKEWLVNFTRTKALDDLAQYITTLIQQEKNIYIVGSTNSGKTYFAKHILLPTLQRYFPEAKYYPTCDALNIHTYVPAIIDEVEILEDAPLLQTLHPEDHPFYTHDYMQTISQWTKELEKIQAPCIALITRNDKESQNYLKERIKICSWNGKAVSVFILHK